MNYYKNIVFLLVVPILPIIFFIGCSRTPHQRLEWKAEEFFSDAGVISLCKAIEQKDLVEIERLVKSGVDINAKGRGNMTPLLWAFPMGEETFKKVLELGADPNIILTKNLLLLKSKSVVFASVELTDGLLHYTYFHDICMDNYLKLVLEHGGNPNIENMSGDTPIYFATSQRCGKEQIRLLTDSGADINHKNHQGRTPLICSVGRQSEYVIFLLKARADYRIIENGGMDGILCFQNRKIYLEKVVAERPNDTLARMRLIDLRPIYDWLSNEGVNWEEARKALESPEIRKNLKNLPADYKHRPWLPQRPTLKKPDDKPEKSKADE